MKKSQLRKLIKQSILQIQEHGAYNTQNNHVYAAIKQFIRDNRSANTFVRIKLTGENTETKWMNIDVQQVQQIAKIFKNKE